MTATFLAAKKCLPQLGRGFVFIINLLRKKIELKWWYEEIINLKGSINILSRFEYQRKVREVNNILNLFQGYLAYNLSPLTLVSRVSTEKTCLLCGLGYLNQESLRKVNYIQRCLVFTDWWVTNNFCKLLGAKEIIVLSYPESDPSIKKFDNQPKPTWKYQFASRYHWIIESFLNP